MGKKVAAEDGRQIYISVIRDISAEKEYQERLKKQAAYYDHLSHSVPAEIIQYRMINGAVEFKNADQEAIRLPGYTSEEFWGKRNWDLASLIVSEDCDRVLVEVEWLRQPEDMSPFEYQMTQKDGN